MFVPRSGAKAGPLSKVPPAATVDFANTPMVFHLPAGQLVPITIVNGQLMVQAKIESNVIKIPDLANIGTGISAFPLSGSNKATPSKVLPTILPKLKQSNDNQGSASTNGIAVKFHSERPSVSGLNPSSQPASLKSGAVPVGVSAMKADRISIPLEHSEKVKVEKLQRELKELKSKASLSKVEKQKVDELTCERNELLQRAALRRGGYSGIKADNGPQFRQVNNNSAFTSTLPASSFNRSSSANSSHVISVKSKNLPSKANARLPSLSSKASRGSLNKRRVKKTSSLSNQVSSDYLPYQQGPTNTYSTSCSSSTPPFGSNVPPCTDASGNGLPLPNFMDAFQLPQNTSTPPPLGSCLNYSPHSSNQNYWTARTDSCLSDDLLMTSSPYSAPLLAGTTVPENFASHTGPSTSYSNTAGLSILSDKMQSKEMAQTLGPFASAMLNASVSCSCVLKPDCHSPFGSFEDCFTRLLPFHQFQGPSNEWTTPLLCTKDDVETQERLRKSFERIQTLYGRFQALLFKEAMAKESTAELCMLSKMFIEHAQSEEFDVAPLNLDTWSSPGDGQEPLSVSCAPVTAMSDFSLSSSDSSSITPPPVLEAIMEPFIERDFDMREQRSYSYHSMPSKMPPLSGSSQMISPSPCPLQHISPQDCPAPPQISPGLSCAQLERTNYGPAPVLLQGPPERRQIMNGYEESNQPPSSVSSSFDDPFANANLTDPFCDIVHLMSIEELATDYETKKTPPDKLECVEELKSPPKGEQEKVPINSPDQVCTELKPLTVETSYYCDDTPEPVGATCDEPVVPEEVEEPMSVSLMTPVNLPRHSPGGGVKSPMDVPIKKRFREKVTCRVCGRLVSDGQRLILPLCICMNARVCLTDVVRSRKSRASFTPDRMSRSVPRRIRTWFSSPDRMTPNHDTKSENDTRRTFCSSLRPGSGANSPLNIGESRCFRRDNIPMGLEDELTPSPSSSLSSPSPPVSPRCVMISPQPIRKECSRETWCLKNSNAAGLKLVFKKLRGEQGCCDTPSWSNSSHIEDGEDEGCIESEPETEDETVNNEGYESSLKVQIRLPPPKTLPKTFPGRKRTQRESVFGCNGDFETMEPCSKISQTVATTRVDPSTAMLCGLDVSDDEAS